MKIFAFDTEPFTNGSSVFETDLQPDLVERAMRTFANHGGREDMDADVLALDIDHWHALVLMFPGMFSYLHEAAIGDDVFSFSGTGWIACGQTHAGCLFGPLDTAEDYEASKALIIAAILH